MGQPAGTSSSLVQQRWLAAMPGKQPGGLGTFFGVGPGPRGRHGRPETGFRRHVHVFHSPFAPGCLGDVQGAGSVLVSTVQGLRVLQAPRTIPEAPGNRVEGGWLTKAFWAGRFEAASSSRPTLALKTSARSTLKHPGSAAGDRLRLGMRFFCMRPVLARGGRFQCWNVIPVSGHFPTLRAVV